MPTTVQYPKRILSNEPFSFQYNVIDNMLVEVKNQPSGYYTNNKRKTQMFKIPASNGVNMPLNASLYPDTQTNTSNLRSGSFFVESGANSFVQPGVQTQVEQQSETGNKSYFFDPFEPLDLNKDKNRDTVEANRNLFNSPLNLDYTTYSTRTSVPNIWGDSKSQGLSKNTSVWA